MPKAQVTVRCWIHSRLPIRAGSTSSRGVRISSLVRREGRPSPTTIWAPNGVTFLVLGDRHYEPAGRANARPMTGFAKQSIARHHGSKDGLLRRLAPRKDG